ncbi:MAG: polysaccharide deacetylase family protein [Conexibacter sp.]
MRRPAATATGAALAAGAAWSLPALAPLAPALCRSLRIPRTLPADGDVARVALTFDDGPHPHGTPAVLEALAAAGARATFFLVGEQVRRHPALAAEIVAAGHALALHGDRHRVQLRLSPRTLAADLDRGHATIAEATGVAPWLYRPPLGIFSPAGLALVRRRGWAPLLWSRWGHDWRLHRTPGQIAAELTDRLAPGDVLLLHDADDYSQPGCWQRTARALPQVLDAIARRGLTTAKL